MLHNISEPEANVWQHIFPAHCYSWLHFRKNSVLSKKKYRMAQVYITPNTRRLCIGLSGKNPADIKVFFCILLSLESGFVSRPASPGHRLPSIGWEMQPSSFLFWAKFSLLWLWSKSSWEFFEESYLTRKKTWNSQFLRTKIIEADNWQLKDILKNQLTKGSKNKTWY